MISKTPTHNRIKEKIKHTNSKRKNNKQYDRKEPKNLKRVANVPYMKFVMSQGCLVCGGAAVAHHSIDKLISEGRRGGKAYDTETVPLCNDHHTELHHFKCEGEDHHKEREFCDRYGLDFRAVIDRLNKEYGLCIV